MKNHAVRVHASDENLPRSEQLAWKIAEVASEDVPATDAVADMVINRIIDNASVAAASLRRGPAVSSRSQAAAHPVSRGGSGSSVFGTAQLTSPEWAAWANGVAVRELDFHDTFLAAEYSHPGDNIPPILAVAQHTGRTGAELLRGIVTGYEIQIDLAKAISLHEFKIDHVAHLGPSAAAGIGTLLGLDTETIFQAIGQALHTTTATRQSRKGEISTWKSHAPAFAGKMAVESVDRAMRGQTSPTPIYEGEDGVIAWLLGGKDRVYEVPLPTRGEPRLAILDSYTKEHSAEYQAQAWIDLARRLGEVYPALRQAQGPELAKGAALRRAQGPGQAQVAALRQAQGPGSAKGPDQIERIVLHTSHHTHNVIGSGAGDPQKYDPKASRETLDHSLPYIFAVALQDGAWDHNTSYAPERAGRLDTVELWRKISTAEDPEWTRRYHSLDPAEKAFGGRIEIDFKDGTRIVDEIAVADAHPLGARPFGREQYINKFRTLADGVLEQSEIERFLEVAQRLPDLTADELYGLTITADLSDVVNPKGLF